MLESISQAFQGVFSHKLRSFLTMLGIIIGIASIITIISTIKGTNEQIKENLIGAGNNVVTVQLYRDDYALSMDYQEPPVGVNVLKPTQRDEMRALEGVADVSFYHLRNSYEVYYKNTTLTAQLFGIDDSFLAVNGYQLRRGRGFTARDEQSHAKVVLLDDVAAKTLFGTEDPVGKTVELKSESFTVVGIVGLRSDFEPRIESLDDYYTYNAGSGGTVLLPDAAWPIVCRFDEPQTVAVRASSTDDMTAAGKAAADYLTVHQIDSRVSENLSYRSNDLLEQAKQLQEMSSSTNNQLIWIASISLLVGGVGVMNIMLVTVTERTGEIGLKKAIGAKRRRILMQFLTEASVLTGIGGLLGVLAGVGMSKLISRFVDMPTAISVPSILIAAVFSVLIGLVFGLVPAVKASKLNPIEALRRD